jgi:mycofactocin precursor
MNVEVTAPAHISACVESDDELVASVEPGNSEQLLEELLIEEISIDGMCGVY